MKRYFLIAALFYSSSALAQVGQPVNILDAKTGRKAVVTSNGALQVVSTGGGGGTVTQGPAGTLANGWPVKLTDGTYQVGTASHPVYVTVSSGSISISGSVAVTGPLTDTQLRASPVVVNNPTASNFKVQIVGTASTIAVSGTVTSTPSGVQHTITDSGTTVVTQATGTNLHAVIDAGAAVIGHVIADTGSTTAVTGNVTAVQATGSNLHAVIDTGSTTAVTSLPVGHNIIDSGTTVVTQPTGTNLHAVLDAGSAVIGHTINDTGSTTAVTGNVTSVQATGTNLHTVVDSGSITANAGTNLNTSLLALSAPQTDRTQKTQLTDGTRDGTVKAASTLPLLTDTAVVTTQRDPLPAGTNVIGHTINDTGSTTAVTGNVTVIQGTGTNLHTVLDSGTTVVTQGTGTNLHTVVDSGAITVSGTVTTTPPSNASTNVTQFGSNNVVTGTGASGVGIPRVTVSNDSTVGLVAGTAVIGHVIADTGSTTAVTGNVAITAASLPLPTGAAQDSTLTGGTAKTQIVDSNNNTLGSSQFPLSVSSKNSHLPGVTVAGIPGVDVITVQGSPFGKPIPVNATITNSVVPVSYAANSLVNGLISGVASPIQIAVPPGSGTLGLQITGSWVGQLNFEGSNDGLNWIPIQSNSGFNSKTNGFFFFVAGGITLIRVNSYFWDSGSAGIFFNASVGSGTAQVVSSIPPGANNIGAVTISGGSIVDVATPNYLLQRCNAVRTINCR